MKNIQDLQKKNDLLQDEIGDTFHAIDLNLKALSVSLAELPQSTLTQPTIDQCQKQFVNLQYLYNQRNNLRLDYLITEQIKEQEGRVRRQRLVEYEDKIYDQRRLISDKEAFYEGLLKPRKRRPPHVTAEEFQKIRRNQILQEERSNFRRLQEEIEELRTVEKMVKMENNRLQKVLSEWQKRQISEEELQNISLMISKNPTVYSNIKIAPYKQQQTAQIIKILSHIQQIQSSNEEVFKAFAEQKQMYQFLKWQNQKLKLQYKNKIDQKDERSKENKKSFKKIGNYKLIRSSSL